MERERAGMVVELAWFFCDGMVLEARGGGDYGSTVLWVKVCEAQKLCITTEAHVELLQSAHTREAKRDRVRPTAWFDSRRQY